jgi:hypothetical protein
MFDRLPRFFCGIVAKLSAGSVRRKWPCRWWNSRDVVMVTAAVLMIAFCGQDGPAAAVPLPKPRPADAPAAKPEASETPEAGQEAPGGSDKPAREQAAPPPQPSACRLALTEAIAIAPSVADIRGPGGCGGSDLVRLEAVVLPDKHRVALKPAAILRCEMASAVAGWIRSDMVGLAKKLGSDIADLDNFDSYECRGRNRIAGAGLSEHGRANALDVRSFRLADGRQISFTDRTVSRDLREAVLHSVCARFSTVLGPGSDGYHEDHIHLDLMERRNDYRICQWDVWDPLPQIAPLLPAERPEEAPPREVAANPGTGKAVSEETASHAGSHSASHVDSHVKPTADQPPAKKKKKSKPPN